MVNKYRDSRKIQAQKFKFKYIEEIMGKKNLDKISFSQNTHF